MRSHFSLFGAAAMAALIPFSLSGAQGLADVGPLNPDNGYPEWYEDGTGLRLSQCLNNSGFCLLDGPVTLSNPELAFPDNYGGTFGPEFFWWACDADMVGPGGETALLVLALEGAFGLNVPGDQVSFARVRIRVTGLVPGETYTVTTPVGVFVFVAEDAARNINFSDDVGILDGVFTGALGGGIGPFFRWDTDLPLTDLDGNEYIGNPTIPHTITGSPVGTNFFQVQGPGLDISTDLFALMGMVLPAVAPPPPAAPVANFSAAPVSGTEPLSVAFTDLSTGDITSRSWDFGDASGSTLQNPTNVYAAGTFSPSLTVTGPGGSDSLLMTDLIAVAVEPPLGNGLVLSQPMPGIAGVSNALMVTGGTPGRVVGVFTGLRQGATILNLGNCGGIPVGLIRPFRLIGKSRVQPNGTAFITVTPPAGTAGKVFHFQAVEPFSCRASNLASDQL